MNVKKQAAKDAFEFARAQMAYGEGAGTRRKLIGAAVQHKMQTLPGYEDAFNMAYNAQDMLHHAENAHKMRKSLDRNKKIQRNVRGFMTGNKQSLTTGVMILGTAAYYAHETGYDKIAWERTKKEYKKAKNWAHAKWTGFEPPRAV